MIDWAEWERVRKLSPADFWRDMEQKVYAEHAQRLAEEKAVDDPAVLLLMGLRDDLAEQGEYFDFQAFPWTVDDTLQALAKAIDAIRETEALAKQREASGNG